VWTKTFKSSAAAEDDVQEDDVEMTVEGGASSAGDPADEDPFEKQMRLSYESQVRASTAQRYGKPQALDQLEEWMKEKPIPYISNDKFSQEGIFHYWGLCVRSWLSGNLGKTALRLTEIIRMYFDTSLKTSRRDYSGLSGPGWAVHRKGIFFSSPLIFFSSERGDGDKKTGDRPLRGH
jgi:hypothetical protein